MKKFVLIALSAALTVACSEQKEDRLDQKRVDEMVRAQRAAAEKTGSKKMNVNFSRKDVSSTTGGFDIDRNESNNVLSAGDEGVFWNGDRLADPDVANTGSEVCVSLNNNGDWIAVGNKSVYVKKIDELEAIELSTVDLGSKESHFSCHMNDGGNWIAVGNQAIYINGFEIQSQDIPDYATRYKAVINDDLTWTVDTNVGPISGVFTESSENSTDESSLQ